MTEPHAVVSNEEWITARKQLLVREKEFTRLRDELSAARRQLPWQRVAKPYRFHTESGTRTLGELFGEQRQLVVYHFMFAPDWEQGCKSCTFWADHFNGAPAHLAQRDVRFTAISRAPLPKLAAYARRLGWSFPWASSNESDFNFDYGVSFRAGDPPGSAIYNYQPSERTGEEQPGLSVFVKDERGEVLHTYSCYARGIEALNATYSILDLVPRGRDEAALSMPMAWVKRWDEYER